MIENNAKIYVAGHRGLVGSAIMRSLAQKGYHNLIVRTHHELDLTRGADVERFFETERPEAVFLAAAKVGGIQANATYPADFIRENLLIATNVLDSAWRFGVKHLLYLGSSCIYPKHCPQPILESYLLTGPLEPTNEPYAIAKIAGLKLCEFFNQQYGTRFLPVMPTNLYGPGDNYNLLTSHVIPALIRKLHDAKNAALPHIELWGTGTPRREFLYADDLADACTFLLFETDANECINIGTGSDITIAELAHAVAQTVGYEGEIRFDHIHPDGTPQKCLNVSKLHACGWQAKTPLHEGLRHAYEDFLMGSFRT